MEQHPVPQNIIDVEFKLFGSFTLRQFGKLLLGCVSAFFIFLIDIPILIKFPLMLVVLVVGVGSAILPNFGVWLNGFLKAIFISPRYVWVKESRTPEVLKQKQEKEVKNNQNVSKSVSSGKVRMDDISLRGLFSKDDTATTAEDPYEKPRDKNLDQIYTQIYQEAEKRKSVGTDNIVKPKKMTSEEEYKAEINTLKGQLSSLVKDQHYKEKESQILNRINDLYQELKMMGDKNISNPQNQKLVDMQGKRDIEGQMIFGLIVDQKEKPVANSNVIFRNLDSGEMINIPTNDQGRFASKDKLEYGSYEVTVEHPNLSFHRYNIKIGQQKLPAYKFRAK